MPDWTDLTKKLEQYLRLKTFPVAFKLLENVEELHQNKWARIPDKKATLCELITRVRCFDWTIGATAENFATPICTYMLGLIEKPQMVEDGTYRAIKWFKKMEDSKKFEETFPHIPFGKYKAVLMAPLVYNPFDPDIILIYGNPAQMILIINALQYKDYERFHFSCVGESSCSDVIAQCYLTGKPSMSIPCYGECRFGHAQDDEMVIAIPSETLGKLVKGLKFLYGRGIRYPISYYGAEVDPTPGLFDAYGGSRKYKKQRIKYEEEEK